VRAAQAAPLDLCPACLLGAALSMADEPCPYQVLAPIGEGTSGVTYLAQAPSGAGGYVALKILKPRDDVDAVLSRYHHWKPALARIQHPSLGKLLAVGLTADGVLYLASEYVTGWPLTALGSHAALGKDERVEIARQLTAAIDAAHAAGVAHLKLDSSKVKISTATGPRAMILGLGSAVIVDGARGDNDRRDIDRLALASIVRELGVDAGTVSPTSFPPPSSP
jgi:serine/threonine-protein kinase